MTPDQLRRLRRVLASLWVISPERMWLLSIALHRRGHPLAAFAVKQINTVLYHNSLAPGAAVAADITLGHYSHGVVVADHVEIGRGVKLWHNVTLTAGRPPRRNGRLLSGPPSRIVIEDFVNIGTNAVVIAPRGQTLRIGRAARIGAGAVVTTDVPTRATAVGPPARIVVAPDAELPPPDAGPSAHDAGLLSQDAELQPQGPELPPHDAEPPAPPQGPELPPHDAELPASPQGPELPPHDAEPPAPPHDAEPPAPPHDAERPVRPSTAELGSAPASPGER
jgi:serine O-acetyltransferase